jgi:streptogramin lyase
MLMRKSACSIFVALVLIVGIFSLPQSRTASASAGSSAQVTSLRTPGDPSTTLIREYQLPVIPLTTIAYLGPARTPFDVAYDSNGYSWVTDIARDAIYRLTPATMVNQTSTTALQWVLPNTEGKRSPLYIVADEAKKVVWFTDPTSFQLSRLNWSNNQLDDWYLGNLLIMPLDLVMQSSNVIWFTGANNAGFFKLQVNTNTVTAYNMLNATGGIIQVRPTRITLNGTCLFLTDIVYDRLYEVPLPAASIALKYPLTHPGFTWDVDVDSGNNAWVTQPLSSLIDEQLAHSVNKSYYPVIQYPHSVPPDTQLANLTTLDVTIQITPVTPTSFSGPLNVTGDPFVVWSIPKGVTAVGYVPPAARPWDVATSADGYAWFTEPANNHIGVIQPNTNKTLLYTVPTSQSLPLSMDIQLGNPYHVWFTEYRSGQIGELFNATYTSTAPGAPIDITVPGLAIGFVAGVVVTALVMVLMRRRAK